LVHNDVPTPTVARDEILAKIKNTAGLAFAHEWRR
jgi:hypothetical protein